MAEEEKKDSKSKVIIIVLIALLIVILAVGTVITVLLLQNNNNAAKPEETTASTQAVTEKDPLILDYDSGAIALNEDDLNKQINEMKEKVGADQISLEYQNIAFSEDGTNFTCHLANSDMNTEDMFIAVYKDATYSERLYLSGLLAPGTVINEFTSAISFDPGEYETVAVFTTVADDHNTMTGQVSVVLKLNVG